MADLHNTKYATFDRAVWGRRDAVNVGNNRTLSLRTIKQPSGDLLVLEFRLHGHMVVEYTKNPDGAYDLVMDSCGYSTTTTRQAIKDALALFGFAGGVSFAKGGFAPRLAIAPYDRSNPDGYVWLEASHVGCDSALYSWKA